MFLRERTRHPAIVLGGTDEPSRGSILSVPDPEKLAVRPPPGSRRMPRCAHGLAMQGCLSRSRILECLRCGLCWFAAQQLRIRHHQPWGQTIDVVATKCNFATKFGVVISQVDALHAVECVDESLGVGEADEFAAEVIAGGRSLKAAMSEATTGNSFSHASTTIRPKVSRREGTRTTSMSQYSLLGSVTFSRTSTFAALAHGPSATVACLVDEA